jgi:uncharacterized protein YciI
MRRVVSRRFAGESTTHLLLEADVRPMSQGMSIVNHLLDAPLRGDVFNASWVAMFVIELIYKVDLAEIDAHMAAHVTFLKKYYTAGNFLVSGRKIPRDGGIILAVGKSRRQIEAIVEEDPFYEHDLADFRIIEFRASQRANDIQKRIERN